jgi:GTP-binding protein LepA
MEKNKIRNFVISAHIDHGKSTLADRFLELTKAVPDQKMREQFLDSMDLERGRGITIKMHPVKMDYQGYSLNLIDTPGHVDFGYEVSRALAAVEGAILLVDATKGIQAQTISNLELAQEQNLIIIPVINKIDSPQARVNETRKSLAQLLNVNEDEISLVSAKTGENVKQLLEKVIEKVPCPKQNFNDCFRALIFDSKYDTYKGVVAFIRVIDGKIKNNQRIHLIQGNVKGEIKELGYFKPELEPDKELKSGEIGYLATGIKEPGKVQVGDTITVINSEAKPLAGYKVPRPMVFASIYSENSNDFENLKEALVKLKLNDSSFVFEPEKNEALGRGFRCGFLGSLHVEIVSERLRKEFNLDLVISTPTVVFKIIDNKDHQVSVFSPVDWPEQSEIKQALEPWIKLEIIVPCQYLGKILETVSLIKGKQIETKYFGSDRVLLVYHAPFKEIVSNFYDNLKGASQGFASMNYHFIEYRPGDLVKMEVFVAGQKEEIFSKIVYKDEIYKQGKKLTEKLKQVLPRQLFSVAIQAVVSGKIIARETISAKRRDVIAPLYGGDYTRKRKLLEKQKKGKQKLKDRGKIKIPAKVFLDMLGQ